MYFGNVMLLILNLPLIGIWVQVLRVPYIILFPIILMFMIIGCYSVNSNVFDVLIMGFFGIFGYLLRKFDFNCAPLIFGLILSPILEGAFRQSLMMSKGSFLIFVERPISLIILIIFVIDCVFTSTEIAEMVKLVQGVGGFWGRGEEIRREIIEGSNLLIE